MLADGRIVDVVDPTLGPVRQPGLAYLLHATPGEVGFAPATVGQHTVQVLEEQLEETAAPVRPKGVTLQSPLSGITVLDIGSAVAGPWGAQMLSVLGARVIKVNATTDQPWHSLHTSFTCSRGKESISLDLKDPDAYAAFRRLADSADVVQHNMRDGAAKRLGIDYDTLKSTNPDLVYCQVRGYEHEGPRAPLPGNDQMAAALTGIDWEDGGCADGGRPFWSLTSMGDTGAGFLSAIAICQALYHRERTGAGQFVDTSLLDAGLLHVSGMWSAGDRPVERSHLDAQQLGLNRWYRLYETAEGWLCLAAVTKDHQVTLWRELGVDQDVTEETLVAIFATRTAAAWASALESWGVPCEVSSETFALGVFDDPEYIAKGWVTSSEHPLVGHLEQFGRLIEFSETPSTLQGPPLVVGQDSRRILSELDFTSEEIDVMVDRGVVLDMSLTPANVSRLIAETSGRGWIRRPEKNKPTPTTS
jgi:crotonobetainyl-CoA:carnitine CoA-transferase CaiB-like acyl-CoA transferase